MIKFKIVLLCLVVFLVAGCSPEDKNKNEKMINESIVDSDITNDTANHDVHVMYYQEKSDLLAIVDDLQMVFEDIIEEEKSKFVVIELYDSKAWHEWLDAINDSNEDNDYEFDMEENSKYSSWKYFVEDYERKSFELKNSDTLDTLKKISSFYGVIQIRYDGNNISFVISNDKLIYSPDDIVLDEDGEVIKIESHWYVRIFEPV